MDRNRTLGVIETGTYDLLVIGGGITGAGVAREASLRGLRVALVEGRDFASGTSSRSTKLIHGGLRYLKQFDFRLVAEAVRERQLLLRMAPHLVQATPFMFPVYRGDPDSLLALRAGLFVYDLFAGLRASVPHRIFAPEQVLGREPWLRRDRLIGGALYTDSRTDDARLTLAVLESATRHGAAAGNYLELEALLRLASGRLAGARVRDTLTGRCYEVRATRVLAAVGPWADFVRRLDDPAAPPILRLTKGVHVAVARERLPVGDAVVMRSRDRDRRMMFAIPRWRSTYLGTTDTDFDQDPDRATAESSDVEYILEATNGWFPGANLTDDDVVSTWVGLRPLVRPSRAASPSAVSRDYQLFQSQSGLVSVGGGKLTAFRAMAEHIISELFPGSDGARVRAASMAALPGADGVLPTTADWHQLAGRTGASPEEVQAWCGMYGASLNELSALFPQDQSGDPGLDWHRAMTRYGVRYEMAQRLEDVYRRRTGLMLFTRDNGRGWLDPLADEMALLLGWSAERKNEEIRRTRAEMDAMFAYRGEVKERACANRRM
ncbi:MAG: glycerol-3-phosphate dehydrogenase/oxidase [Chloroflexi bacterium]|nr:glycerol-3-phosphate dehydrogenase/oxidase [Chloroflexota bacterium]